MSNIRTHYDVLNVSRNASIEVIRAAYKTLSQKYHPDKFQSEVDKQKANRIMFMLNDAYQVLSDPLQRFEYDNWIAEQEKQQAISQNNGKTITVNLDYGSIASIANRSSKKFSNSLQSTWLGFSSFLRRFIRELSITLLKMAIPLIIVGLCIFMLINFFDKSPEPVTTSVTSEPIITPSVVEPVSPNNTDESSNKKLHRKAPNGQPFPDRPTYVKGYPKLNTDGLSTITVENTQNTSDIFGKLIYLDNGQPQAVRHFFIPAGGGFIMRDVAKGNYDIRYKDLDNGDIAKSEPFEVQEFDDGTGTQFSNITMTLYKVANGNMRTTQISESEF